MAFNFFGGGGSPASEAMPYFDEAGRVQREYIDPYVQRGGRSGDILESQFGQLSTDPLAMYKKFIEGYQPSKAYEFKQKQMGQTIANTAAAGGGRGSPMEQQQQAELTQGLLSQDMQEFMNNIMQLYGTGLSGEQGLYGTGFQASRSLADNLSNILGTEGQLAFQEGREKGQRGQDILSSLMSLASMFRGAGGFPG